MNVLVLRLGIFPDAETLERALARLPRECDRTEFDLSQDGSGERDWDRVLDRLLAADRIIVV